MKSLIVFAITFAMLLISPNGRAQVNSCACCTENHKAFDFWLGTWQVTNTDGSLAGTNTIVKTESDCVIRENWTSANEGYTGTSTNFYNLETNQWEQLWIDSSGAHLKLKGKRVGNQMILISDDIKKDDGALSRNRITWTKNDDGTVRQLWEILNGEKVISVAFDGLYKKNQ